MQYVYAALLLNGAGKKITEDAVKKVINATGAKAEDVKTKALVAALEGVDIKEVMEKSATAPVVAASAAPVETKEKDVKEGKAEEKEKEDEGKTAEEAAAGLSALFG